MKKNRILAVAAMCIICLLVTLPQTQKEPYAPGITTIDLDNIDQNENVTVKVLTDEEFENKYKEITGKTIAAPRGDFKVAEVSYTDEETFGRKYAIEVGCLVRMGCGQSCSWNEVVDGTAYSKAVGTGDHTWDQFTVYAEMRGTSSNKRVEMDARGVVEVAVDYSQSQEGSIGIGADLIDLGYSFEKTIGKTDYFRKLGTISCDLYESDFL